MTLLIFAAVAFLYLGCARSVNGRFLWKADLTGYYDLLSLGFLSGHLYLPVEPAPELLQLADPWDPVQNRLYRLPDAVLYHQHYYLYHGVAPAVLLFTPWRFVTGHDFPESFAAFLFCFGGFLFSGLMFIDLLEYSGCRLPVAVFAMMLLALGVAQSVPYLLQRVLMYEVAIASGYFFLMAGFFSFFRCLTAERSGSLYAFLSGTCFGFVVGCRPHLIFGAFFAALWLLFREVRRKGLRGFVVPRTIAFMAPLALIGIALAIYNYARFGSPVDFGMRYQLDDVRHPSDAWADLSMADFLPGLYYLVACPPDFENVFPFIRLAMRPPFNITGHALPINYRLDPIAGFIAICPLALMAILFPLFLHRLTADRNVRTTIWLLFLTAASCLLFIAGTGWSMQRYEVDFFPVMVLIGCYVAAALYNCLAGKRQNAFAAAIALSVVYGAGANLALAVQGPYDSLVQVKPASYVKIARLFSLSGNLRPRLNPRVSVEAMVQFPDSPRTAPEPLLSTGEFGSRYSLEVEKLGKNKARLISAIFPRSRSTVQSSSRTVEVDLAPGSNDVALEFDPTTLIMTVRWNGNVTLTHHLSSLVTARAQLKFGEENSYGRILRFSGHVVPIRQIVEYGPGG